ncbi:MAG: hypothetical protein IT175_11940 [Acidobacteria bacterium]|nr:hypothetical protein [Acidobacteriota bacterium]
MYLPSRSFDLDHVIAGVSPAPLYGESRVAAEDMIVSLAIDAALVWSVLVPACSGAFVALWVLRRARLPRVVAEVPVSTGRQATDV